MINIKLSLSVNEARAFFEQGVPWHWGNYRMYIHSETRMWHDNNIQFKNLFEWIYPYG